MNSDIIIIGAGAAGLMASIGAAEWANKKQIDCSLEILEKMPRPGRKIMITGKGRCNLTNVKDWNEFSTHIRSNANFIKPAFFNLTPERLLEFFENHGTPCVVERGDRAFPASHKAGEVVDTLVHTAEELGVKITTYAQVDAIELTEDENYQFVITTNDGATRKCKKLIIATGGLSYPSTGSTGDGLMWAEDAGHQIKDLQPALTALVPEGYKIPLEERQDYYIDENLKGHVDRRTPLSKLGKKLCGIDMSNVSASLLINNDVVQTEFGDIQFTDGGIEGPVGFQLSRDCVKSIMNGNKCSIIIDLKPAVKAEDLSSRLNSLWTEIITDPRSADNSYRQSLRILLGKLMPWDLIAGFLEFYPNLLFDNLGRRRRNNEFEAKTLAHALKNWRFEIEGYVGYERSVITAGGVATEEIVAKTLESKKIKNMYFCGEVTNADGDTGGYNLHIAFSTGYLAGINAVKSL